MLQNRFFSLEKNLNFYGKFFFLNVVAWHLQKGLGAIKKFT